MASLTIRCHPVVPVSISELESWLARQLEELRDEMPELGVRLLRLTQPLPGGDLQVGWLVELELPGELRAHVEQHVLPIVTDMRMLGLQPTLLRPQEPAAPEQRRGAWQRPPQWASPPMAQTGPAGESQGDPAAPAGRR